MESVTRIDEAVWMKREHWEGLPEYAVPTGFSVRWYAPGDEEHWRQIQLAADPLYSSKGKAFFDVFGGDAGELAQRVCFLLDGRGEAIGTAAAWRDWDFGGERYGRVHWIAIVAEQQGRGLGKVLLSVVCRRLMELGHEKAYLKTSSGRLNAIQLYKDFGFTPVVRDAREAELWREVEVKLGARSEKREARRS